MSKRASDLKKQNWKKGDKAYARFYGHDQQEESKGTVRIVHKDDVYFVPDGHGMGEGQWVDKMQLEHA